MTQKLLLTATATLCLASNLLAERKETGGYPYYPLGGSVPAASTGAVPTRTTYDSLSYSNFSLGSFGSRNKGFVQVGPSYLRLSPNWDEHLSFYGVALSAGFYPTEHQRLSIDTGLYYYSESEFDTYNGTPVLAKTDIHVIPVLLTWNWEWHFDSDWHLRMGPSIGASIGHGKIGLSTLGNGPSTFGNSVSGDALFFTYGLGIGVSWDVSKHCFVDIGYKLMRTSTVKFKIEGERVDAGSYFADQFTISIGFRF